MMTITATVTALSVRRDGTGFLAELPGETEKQWLSLPPPLHGKVEWKKTYQVSYVKKPKNNGGFFYNVQTLGRNGAAQAAAQAQAMGLPLTGLPATILTEKDRLIFAEAIVKGWLDRIEVGDTKALAAAVRSAYAAYDLVHNDEMDDRTDDPNDEIPY